MIVTTLEITGVTDISGTTTTFYLSDVGFSSKPTDSPSNQTFTPRLIDPGSIGRHAYSDASTTGGNASLEIGELSLANMDRALDPWLDYGFDGQLVVIRRGTLGDPYPSGYKTLFLGTAESLDAPGGEMRVRLRDKEYIFELPAQATRYLGNNVLPAGLEGTPDDIGGSVKPLIFGRVFQVPAVQVNTSKLTYQVNDGTVQSIPLVYDGALALTPGADYATSALMLAAAPGVGTFITCLAEGYFRLGGAGPASLVTADVIQGATAADRTAAQILRQLAMRAGVDSLFISASDVVDMDFLNSAEVGIWIDDSGVSTQSAMSQIAESVGGWYGFDGVGDFRMGILSVPTGTPVLSLRDYHFKNQLERRPARDNGIPVWRVVVEHTRVWAVQTSGVLGAVTPAMRAYVERETRKAEQVYVEVLLKHLLAGEMTAPGLLTNVTDGNTEALRLLELYKVRRDVIDVPISVDVLPAVPLLFMDVIELTTNSFGLDDGKLFRLIGIRLELGSNQAILTLWG